MMKPDAADTTGIWPPYQAFYIHSMLFCTASALRSISLLNKNLEKICGSKCPPAEVAFRQRAVLDSLQNILSQGAALSRFLWPARQGIDGLHKLRAEHLRRILGIGEENVLRDRTLRNALEHFDEQLDVHLQGHVVGHVIPEYVGPTPERSGVPVHVFRAFYADTGVFEMLGKRYQVEPIADEIGRIHDLLLEREGEGTNRQERGGAICP